MKSILTGNLVEDLKRALDARMSACAGVSNRLHALHDLASSAALPNDQFLAIIGQAPSTLERDLNMAREDFQQAKADYEAFCARMGLTAYATYSED